MARPRRKPAPEPAAPKTAEVVSLREPVRAATTKIRWTKLGAKKRAWLNGGRPVAGEVVETDMATAKQAVERGFAEPA